MDEKKYEDLGNTIAQLAEKAQERLEDAVRSREKDVEKPKPEKKPAPPPRASDITQQSKTLLNAVHTLEEKTHSLEVTIEGLRKERAQLMGRIRALNAMLSKARSAG